ncbi:MAG: hypothetical protein MK137_02545 [Rickettsiales bacterium]|nr:hypothetical protein [Rickettsiales bacterium]
MSRQIPHRMIAEKAIFVNYVETKDGNGDTHFYYIAVRAKNMDVFKRSLTLPSFDPEAHGVILESGDGSSDAAMKQQMEMLYGCDHSGKTSLLDRNTQ